MRDAVDKLPAQIYGRKDLALRCDTLRYGYRGLFVSPNGTSEFGSSEGTYE